MCCEAEAILTQAMGRAGEKDRGQAGVRVIVIHDSDIVSLLFRYTIIDRDSDSFCTLEAFPGLK